MSQLGLRKLISTGRWTRIRRHILLERGPVCAACGFKADETRLMNAHEVFDYDTRKEIVHLTTIELLCPWCHQCHHFDHYQRLVSVGFGGETLSEERLIKHYCRSCRECGGNEGGVISKCRNQKAGGWRRRRRLRHDGRYSGPD
jgi:hypothetical protein